MELNALNSVLEVARMILASRAAVWRWSRSSERRDPSLQSLDVFSASPLLEPSLPPLPPNHTPHQRPYLLGEDWPVLEKPWLTQTLPQKAS